MSDTNVWCHLQMALCGIDSIYNVLGVTSHKVRPGVITLKYLQCSLGLSFHEVGPGVLSLKIFTMFLGLLSLRWVQRLSPLKYLQCSSGYLPQGESRGSTPQNCWKKNTLYVFDELNEINLIWHIIRTGLSKIDHILIWISL